MSGHTAQAAKPIMWRWPRTEERYGREFSGGWAYEEDYDSIPTWVKYNGDDIEPLYAEALANSHADLVKALEDVLAWFDGPNFVPKIEGVVIGKVNIGPITQGVIDRARQALAKVATCPKK